MPEPLRWDMILPNGQPLRFDMGPEFTWDGNVPEHLYPTNTMSTQQNLADITITDAAHTSITTKLGVVRGEIEAVATEVPADVAENLFRLGDKRLMFDQLCDTNMHQFANTVPDEVDLAKYDADGATILKLRAYQALLIAMLERVQGAIALHGSDRMDANLTYFNYLKFGKRTGMANAAAIHDAIAPHYPTGRRGNPAPTPTP
jgi:hypothetical protein